MDLPNTLPNHQAVVVLSIFPMPYSATQLLWSFSQSSQYLTLLPSCGRSLNLPNTLLCYPAVVVLSIFPIPYSAIPAVVVLSIFPISYTTTQLWSFSQSSQYLTLLPQLWSFSQSSQCLTLLLSCDRSLNPPNALLCHPAAVVVLSIFPISYTTTQLWSFSQSSQNLTLLLSCGRSLSLPNTLPFHRAMIVLGIFPIFYPIIAVVELSVFQVRLTNIKLWSCSQSSQYLTIPNSSGRALSLPNTLPYY